MNYTMERWYSAVGQRFSMRKYKGSPDAQDMQKLREVAKMLSVGGVQVRLFDQPGILRPLFLGFGKIRGTSCFAALISEGAQPRMLGYIGESFVLECVAMGLGTCWVGGSYRKAAVERLANLSEGQRVACVIAVGKPGEPYIGRSRKPLDELTDLTQEELVDLPEWQQLALGCARLAPSAINAQPWRFRTGKNFISVEQTQDNFGFGALDNGIAMLHIELGAAHGGVVGEWQQEGHVAVFVASEESLRVLEQQGPEAADAEPAQDSESPEAQAGEDAQETKGAEE